MVGLSPIEQMPVIMLLVTMAVLLSISYLVTDASLKGTREVSFEIKSDSLDKQYLFWLGIIVPIGIFFYLEYFVFLSNKIGFNSVGFKAFFDESKLPLGVLALSPIFGVIVSNIHKSIQTEKEIIASEGKNTIDSFYAHYKYTTEEFRRLDEKKQRLIIMNPNYLYKKAFPEASYINGVGCKSESFVEELIFYTTNINNLISNIGIMDFKTYKNKKVNNIKETVSEFMYMDTDLFKGIDYYKLEIFKLLEVEAKLKEKFDVYDSYIHYHNENFENPYFEYEQSKAHEQQNWHILQYPELISEDYILDNVIKFLKVISQTVKMIFFLVNKVLDILDSRNAVVSFSLLELRNSTSMVDSFSEILKLRKLEIEYEINGY